MKKTVLDQIPEHIRALVGYVPGKPMRQAERESGVAMIKMASNENPFGPSPLALEAIREAAAQVNLYPDNDASELREALAVRHKLRLNQVLVSGGTTPLLDIVARAVLAPGLNAITSERSFISYPIVTQVTGAKLITTPVKNNGYDLDAIAAAINEETRAIFLANPNNPTGTMFNAAATEVFLQHVPENVLVVLDEAYYEFATYFAEQKGYRYTESIEYIRNERPNLIVLRTFSKAHGLAGLRVGYACGAPALLQSLSRIRNSFSVSGIAEAAALAAIADQSHISRTVENNAAGAVWLLNRLNDLGLHATPTATNFIFVEIDADANAFAQRMQSKGVLVRSLVPWGIPKGIRITIGTPEQNENVLGCLQKILFSDHALSERTDTP
jgi:histidinol-phosphate aminotransferase